MYHDYLTSCPECGHKQLVVIKVTLMSTGGEFTICSELKPDGFEFDPGNDVKDCSTTDEKVLCPNCKKEYDLTELMLDGD